MVIANKYIWIFDTLKRHSRLTREQLTQLWLQAPQTDGKPFTRRSFARYIEKVQSMFDVTIKVDKRAWEYYIEDDKDLLHTNATEWLLNSLALSTMTEDVKGLNGRIFLEDVPSARQYLSSVMQALRESRILQFDYFPYTRTGGTTDVMLEPYFLKIFRQRWYVTGFNPTDNKVKTYALDRMRQVKVLAQKCKIDPAFDIRDYVSTAFGVIYDNSEPRKVTIKTTAQMAKYLRDLPLHHSQQEDPHDDYSLFNYKLKLTRDLVQELMSRGSDIEIIAPMELRTMMINELHATLNHYETRL